MIQHPARGISFLIGALFLFATLDTIAKHLTQSFSVPLLVWSRYVVHCLLMLIFLAPKMGWRLIASTRPLRQTLRALCLVGCTSFGIAALSRMPLAETTATFFISPVLVCLLAAFWLKESLSLSRWLAVLGGFAGILLIARPGGAVNADALLLILSAASCYAVYQILTRQLAATENPLTMLFYTALVGTIAVSLALPWFWYETQPTLSEGLLIASLGILGGSGHLLLTHAFRHTSASLLAPFFYLQLVWATALGAIVFGQWPDIFSWIGMGIIVASGLAIGHQMQRRADQSGGLG